MRAKYIAAVLVVLLLSGGTFAWWFNRPDPQLAKAEAISQKIFQGNNGPPDISNPEVREQLQELRTEVEAMPEATREQFMEGRRQDMQQQMTKQFERYFAMTPEEKEKELDRVIDSMSNMRKTFEKQRAEREKNGGGDAAAGGPGGRGPGGPGFGPPRGPRDPAARQERGKKMLDSTTPEFRAQMTEFARDMSARMKKRGMESPFPGGPPF